MRKGILNGTVKILHNDFIHINWTCYADFMKLKYNMSEVKYYHLEESTHSFGSTVKVKKQSNKNSASFFPQQKNDLHIISYQSIFCCFSQILGSLILS